jgi:NADH pyrophosphatase NudC (nudix superfamily)
MEGRQRAMCSASCGYVFYDNPTPVVAAIVEIDGAVVLVQNKGWPSTWFGLVTGFLEKGESPEVGVLREVQEELGLSATDPRLVGVYGFAQMNQIIVAYHVQATGAFTLGDELADAKLVPIAKLKPWPFGTGDAVRDFLARRKPARAD